MYGLLIALAVLLVAWFAVVVPSERRDHERKLALIRKRLAQRESAAKDSSIDAQGGSARLPEK